MSLLPRCESVNISINPNVFYRSVPDYDDLWSKDFNVISISGSLFFNGPKKDFRLVTFSFFRGLLFEFYVIDWDDVMDVFPATNDGTATGIIWPNENLKLMRVFISKDFRRKELKKQIIKITEDYPDAEFCIVDSIELNTNYDELITAEYFPPPKSKRKRLG